MNHGWYLCLFFKLLLQWCHWFLLLFESLFMLLANNFQWCYLNVMDKTLREHKILYFIRWNLISVRTKAKGFHNSLLYRSWCNVYPVTYLLKLHCRWWMQYQIAKGLGKWLCKRITKQNYLFTFMVYFISKNTNMQVHYRRCIHWENVTIILTPMQLIGKPTI